MVMLGLVQREEGMPVLEQLSERRKLAKQVSEVNLAGNCTSSLS